jgi:light-regulated signal transduction histidine kinase (bacteriophytochrome)
MEDKTNHDPHLCLMVQTDFEQMVNVLRHDLQDTLRLVISYLRLLENHRLQLSPNDREFLSYALDSADRCQHLVSGLLAYARVAGAPVSRVVVDCQEMVGQVVEDLQLVIEDTQAVIQYQGLPVVEADPEQMELVFHGLIETAVHHCRDCPPQVKISADPTSEGWDFTIHMNGPEIEPGEVDKLFLLFAPVSPVVKDPGVDLAICKRVIQNHNGKIWAASRNAEGVTIGFSIPRADQSPNPEVVVNVENLEKGE